MKLKFDEDKHEYKFGDNILSGVTEFIGTFFEPFDKERLSKIVAEREGKTQKQVLQEWIIKRDWGIQVHKLIENHLNGKKKENYPKEVMDAISFLQSIPHTVASPEKRMYSIDWMIAGTIDIVLENPDGGVTLIDWKTTSNLKMDNPYQNAKSPISHLNDCNYVKYLLQLNMYKTLFEKQYHKNVNKMYFVVLSNEKQSTSFQVNDLSHEINLMLQHKTFPDY